MKNRTTKKGPAKRLQSRKLFLAKVKNIGKKIVAGWTCPLGSNAIQGFKIAERQLEALPERWQAKVIRRAERAYSIYHTPVVTGRDGREYSAYDMDRAMMYY